MIIAAVSWRLHLPGAHSLKEKRSVLSRIKARMHNEFNVSVAETAHQEAWQMAELTACVVAGDRRHADSVVESLDRFVGSSAGCRVIDTVRTFF